MTTPANGPPIPAQAPRPEPALTWFRLHDGTSVIDFPFVIPPGTRTWAATLWPDQRSEGGWARHPWQPGPDRRGFVPAVAELGDVIQFGAEPVAAGGKAVTPAPSAIYWHGYLHAVQTDSLLIRGPYPGPGEAFAAAQQALLTQIHGQRGRDTDAQPGGPARPATPLTPAQPPATVSVAFHDDAATVGDPAHGWLVVPAEHLLAAMAHPPGQLAALLREGGPRLTGREPLLTLAALTARHVGHLQPSPLYAPAPPAAAPQVPQQDAPRLPSPPAAPGAQPPHGWAPPSGPSREAGV